MSRQIHIGFALALLAGLGILIPSETLGQRRKSTEEPKTQVVALPAELPMALQAETSSIDFHVSPLLSSGGLSAQIRRNITDLMRDTKGETIIKLRAFVAGAGDARRVQTEVSQMFSDHKLPLPVLTIVQVGSLGIGTAQVTMEAIVATHHSLNPNGLAFASGQTGASLEKALDRLKESFSAATVVPENVLACTCFTSRIDDLTAVRKSVQNVFPKAGITVVQALRDPAVEMSTCEAVGQLSQPPAESALVWLKNRRTAIVNTHTLVFTGLQLSFGSFLDDAHEAFARLERAATALQAVEAPVEVNAFSLDGSGGSALLKTTTVPASVFTVQTVEGLPSVDASGGIEAVLAPNVPSPATVSR